MRKYLKEKNPDYIIIINSKTYKNLKGKIRGKKYKNSESSDSGANTIRIRPNPPPLYNINSK